ncbi:MAG: hypothetical protein AAGI11_13385 [Pseudomonadota bacterium]
MIRANLYRYVLCVTGLAACMLALSSVYAQAQEPASTFATPTQAAYAVNARYGVDPVLLRALSRSRVAPKVQETVKDTSNLSSERSLDAVSVELDVRMERRLSAALASENR